MVLFAGLYYKYMYKWDTLPSTCIYTLGAIIDVALQV